MMSTRLPGESLDDMLRTAKRLDRIVLWDDGAFVIVNDPRPALQRYTDELERRRNER